MWDVGAGTPAGVRNTGAQGPRSRGEGIVILNSWSVLTEPSNDQGQVNVHFCVKDVS